MSLLDKYYGLLNKEVPAGCYLSSKISDNSNNRLAIDQNKSLSLLISTSKFDRSDFSPIKLSNIAILPNVKCKIHEKGETIQDFFTIISFHNDSESLKEYFIKVSESSLLNFPKNPTIKDIYDTIYYLVEIFRYVSDTPRKSVLGLWGELFFINCSKNPEILLDYWHNDIYELHDFSSINESYEIKCSINERRIHNFSLQQLAGKSDAYIVSILTKPLTNGHSLKDIIDSIYSKVNNQRLLKKLSLIVSQTLGNKILSVTDYCYDYELAESTIKCFSTASIPKIKHQSIPSNVFDVRFKVVLTEIPSTTMDSLNI